MTDALTVAAQGTVNTSADSGTAQLSVFIDLQSLEIHLPTIPHMTLSGQLNTVDKLTSK